MDVTTILLTPELAAELLANQNIATGVDAGKVAMFAQTMTENRWRAGSRIGFYADGALFDGAHRCHVVLASGCSILVEVCTVDWLFSA